MCKLTQGIGDKKKTDPFKETVGTPHDKQMEGCSTLSSYLCLSFCFSYAPTGQSWAASLVQLGLQGL